MRILLALLGIVLIFSILFEGFETIVQPRRVTRRYRITRAYFIVFWASWRWGARNLFHKASRRAAFLSAFGPLSLLGLFTMWVTGLVFGFGLLQWGMRDPIFANASRNDVGIGTYLYLSGTTFFTLGYGDVTPTGLLGRFLAVIESGLGFGFLAAILSYLPAIFQAYSRREVNISLLDARAGSPPQRGPSHSSRPRRSKTPMCSIHFSRSGNGGRRNYSKASSPFPCWLITARSMTTSRGSRRSRPCSTPAQ